MTDIYKAKPENEMDSPGQRFDAESHALACALDITHGIEKFTATDLATLRSELLNTGIDQFQAAQLVTNFLCGRGYGISTDEARVVASKVEGVGCTVERLEEELERVARVA